MKTVGIPESQADDFIKVWGDDHLAVDIGTKLTCNEVETLAAMLAGLGASEEAETWISAHAEGDDCGDTHCLCDECGNEIKEP